MKENKLEDVWTQIDENKLAKRLSLSVNLNNSFFSEEEARSATEYVRATEKPLSLDTWIRFDPDLITVIGELDFECYLIAVNGETWRSGEIWWNSGGAEWIFVAENMEDLLNNFSKS